MVNPASHGWTQKDQEASEPDLYCDMCGKPMRNGDEEHLDANGNVHCSFGCVDEANFDIGRDQ